MLTPLHLPAAQTANLRGLTGGLWPSTPGPGGGWAERQGGPRPEGAWALCRVRAGSEKSHGVRCWEVRSDLVLEATWEVAHEEVGLIALHLPVLHGPLPKQGVEMHGQHSAGPLLIPGGLLACGGEGQGKAGETRPARAPGGHAPSSSQPPTYPQVQVGELFRTVVQHEVGVPREEDALVLPCYRHWLQFLHPPYVQAGILHRGGERRATAGGKRGGGGGQGP